MKKLAIIYLTQEAKNLQTENAVTGQHVSVWDLLEEISLNLEKAGRDCHPSRLGPPTEETLLIARRNICKSVAAEGCCVEGLPASSEGCLQDGGR